MEGMVDPAAWAGKKVLVTGHTGFKGSWLCHWLADLGAVVSGYALPPVEADSLFDSIGLEHRIHSIIADINDQARLQAFIRDYRPDVVFHLAAQSLVRQGYENPVQTLATNVIGTVNLLDALRACEQPCNVIIVTSDKCYLNNRDGTAAFSEEDPLGGHDPYSASKACAELVTASYRQSYFDDGPTRVASVRAGNVIGGGDMAVDRLIPDLVRAWLDDRPLLVRYPDAVRPWQHVLEPLSGYLMLAEAMGGNRDFCRAWNFGPRHEDMISVMEVLASARSSCPGVELECVYDDGPREAAVLRLDSGDAGRLLGWHPRWCVDDAVTETMAWYAAWRAGDDMSAMTSDQIERFGETT